MHTDKKRRTNKNPMQPKVLDMTRLHNAWSRKDVLQYFLSSGKVWSEKAQQIFEEDYLVSVAQTNLFDF